MTPEKKRWQYRFDSFSGAYASLCEAAERSRAGELDQLSKEGMIRRFGICMELAWKTMKDYLESEKVTLIQVTPKAVLRESLRAGLVSDGEVWMNALDARGEMSRSWDFSEAEVFASDIQSGYLDCLGELREKLSEACADPEPTEPASGHGLSEKHLNLIRDTIRESASDVESVSIFGSRAVGRHRNYSDVDIVLYGDVRRETVDRLRTCFYESSLPYDVDVVAYRLVKHPPLKAHIDRFAKVLLPKETLLRD